MTPLQGRSAWLVMVALAGWLSACRDDVVLGAWGSVAETPGEGSGGTAGEAGAAGGAGGDEGSGMPACLEPGTPGPLSVAGPTFGATETATDWTWPSPVSSMQWDLMVEREIERPSPTSPPTSGYYYAYQFSFLEGVVGFIGIQAEGVYQQDPPSSPVEVTKIAVFWLSGPPLAAELGDIAYPDARAAPTSAAGVSYLTIHARFDWQACRVYRFRVGPDGTEADGSIWYGAFIEDTSSGVETFLGRMLLPADIGPLSPFSVSRTMPIEFGAQDSCEIPAQASVVFGVPSADAGNLEAARGGNRLAEPPSCPTSRFTNFAGAVRHELGLRP